VRRPRVRRGLTSGDGFYSTRGLLGAPRNWPTVGYYSTPAPTARNAEPTGAINKATRTDRPRPRDPEGVTIGPGENGAAPSQAKPLEELPVPSREKGGRTRAASLTALADHRDAANAKSPRTSLRTVKIQLTDGSDLPPPNLKKNAGRAAVGGEKNGRHLGSRGGKRSDGDALKERWPAVLNSAGAFPRTGSRSRNSVTSLEK